MSEVMKINSPRFGEIKCPKDKIIYFVIPILGFPNSKRYIILEHDKECDFKWLLSIDEPEIAFVIIDPTLLFSDYPLVVFEKYSNLFSELEIKDINDLSIINIVTIPPDPTQATVNLLAPIVVNSKTFKAKQVILEGSDLPIKYPLFSQDENKKQR